MPTKKRSRWSNRLRRKAALMAGKALSVHLRQEDDVIPHGMQEGAAKPRDPIKMPFVHIDGTQVDVTPDQDQSADAVKARVRRWRSIVANEVRRAFPAESSDRKAAKDFAFSHSLSIANAFHRQIARTDVVAALVRLYKEQKDDDLV